MRVGLDHLPGVTHFPGVGRYARELVRALLALPRAEAGDLELGLLQLGGARRIVPRSAWLPDAPQTPYRRFAARVPRRMAAPVLAVLGADRLVGSPAVFHRMAAGWPPLARARSVLAVSELPRPGEAAERRLAHALAREDQVLAFSDFAAHELAERFAVPKERIARVPVGCDHWVRDQPTPPPRDDPPSILVLGALRRERGHELVIDAFDRMVEGGVDARLVFAGGGGDATEAVRRRLAFAASRARIEWHPALPDREVGERVARASLLVHLSESEATAVTPLEAFAAGTPVLASDLPAFREVLGGLAGYVPTAAALRHRRLGADQLAAGLASARDAGGERARRALAAGFGWAAAARAHLAVYRRLDR